MAILANGRLVASGALDDLTAFQARGWELVVTGLRDEVLTRVRPMLSNVTRLGGERFALELSALTAPERLISDLVATGVQLVSLNPLRSTLEDVFVAQVRAAAHDRFDEEQINQSLRSLFDTGLFADITIRRDDDVLVGGVNVGGLGGPSGKSRA